MRHLLWPLLCAGALGSFARAEGPARPNVLLICVDDLNDWVGPWKGHPQVRTPRIDRLAQRGTTFTNAHCQAPLCNPSRTSFLTGLRPSTTGVYALNVWFRDDPKWKNVVTLPQHFMANGYRVLTCGKVFHDAYPPVADRTNGKEVTVWGHHGSMGPLPPAKFVETPDPIKAMDWGVFPDRDEQLDDWKVGDWAIGQLQSKPEGPFFLSVGFRRPHVPCFAPRKWFDLYPDDTLVMPPVLVNDRDDTPRFSWYLHWKLPEPRRQWLQEAGQERALVRAYLACVSFMDSQVGRVLDALDASGLAERTIVVLLSDHGWHLGEKGVTGKNTLWERSTRVPFLFAGPNVSAGVSHTGPVELLDLYPTLLDLTGLPPRAGLEGHSLAPQLANAEAPREWPAITTHGPDNHAVRDERWRFIRYADGSEELYDHTTDPNEWTNLAHRAEHTATREGLARKLPRTSAKPLPGGVSRLIELRDGSPHGEGRPIQPDGPVPMR